MMRAAARLLVALALWPAAAAAVVQATDDDGATITLPQPARRIVSLAPHLTELLFAAGAGERVVGAAAYSDFPAQARELPRIGDSAQLDLERIVALKPDLVVVWRDGNSAQQLDRVAALKLPVYASRNGRLDDIASTLRRLGTLAGTDAVAQARAAAYEAELRTLRTRYASARPLSVFYQIWHRPLMTVNARHPITEALSICGARNVFAELPLLTPTVAEEAVVRLDPDAIVTGSVDPGGADNLDTWRRLRALRAVRDGHLVVVDPDKLHRMSDRIVDGTRELCEKLERVRDGRSQPAR